MKIIAVLTIIIGYICFCDGISILPLPIPSNPFEAELKVCAKFNSGLGAVLTDVILGILGVSIFLKKHKHNNHEILPEQGVLSILYSVVAFAGNTATVVCGILNFALQNKLDVKAIIETIPGTLAAQLIIDTNLGTCKVGDAAVGILKLDPVSYLSMWNDVFTDEPFFFSDFGYFECFE